MVDLFDDVDLFVEQGVNQQDVEPEDVEPEDVEPGNVEPENVESLEAAASRVIRESAYVQLRTHKIGTRRTVDREHREQVGHLFHARTDDVGASKRLFDLKNDGYRNVVKTISRARAYWESMTITHPMESVRVIRRDRVDEFADRIEEYRSELKNKVDYLQHNCWESMVDEAKRNLGSLYNPEDYPADITSQFRIEWQLLNIEPPDYLRQLNPNVYDEQIKLMQSQIETAITKVEGEFLNEFASMVGFLAERLEDGEDGKKKVFRNSAIENLKMFFDRFDDLKVRSNPQFDALIEQAKNVVSGVKAEDVRKSDALRASIRESMQRIGDKASEQIVSKPSRKIKL